MIDCSDAVRRLWDYLDGSVGEADRHAIEEHLDVCKSCCGEAEFAAELQGFLESHAGNELPDDARVRLTTFLEQI